MRTYNNSGDIAPPSARFRVTGDRKEYDNTYYTEGLHNNSKITSPGNNFVNLLLFNLYNLSALQNK